jgi:acyl-CoA reductase-like NAD-dependent aldehyde dehydrogenase
MAVWRDEVFGAVVEVREAQGFDDAVAATNDSRFGLLAAVFTQSLRRAHRFADLAAVGHFAVSLPTSGWDVHRPFGGFRESGSRFKEQGLDAIHFDTRTKTVAVHFDA